jgi:uncharacterized protein YbaP (TraB family)
MTRVFAALVFVFGFAALSLLPALGKTARADPAMWVVRDADSTLYLLGTSHMVKPGTAWRSDKLDAAFAASEDVWLETSGLDETVKVQALVIRLGLDPKHPLSTKLTPEIDVRLKEVAAQAGVDGRILQPMRPWLAALTIVATPLLKAGYDPKQGVDQVLERDTAAANKKLRTFETPEEQIKFFANLPQEVELAFLSQSLVEAETVISSIEQMTAAWLAGDVEGLDADLMAQMQAEAPEIYDALIVQRNAAWTDALAKRLEGKGTSFVAVGAAHLSGAEGLPERLKARGFEVTRYQ